MTTKTVSREWTSQSVVPEGKPQLCALVATGNGGGGLETHSLALMLPVGCDPTQFHLTSLGLFPGL